MIRKNIEVTFLLEDDSFAKKVKEVLELHLTQPGFSTQKFCSLMNMSRAQLHRKIKSSTGFSTSMFIHYYRIKASIELLNGFKANIGKISKEVGYSDASYYTKCFKKITGCTPRQYIELSDSQNTKHLS